MLMSLLPSSSPLNQVRYHGGKLLPRLICGVVSNLALQGNPIAEKALLYHYIFLARGTANLAVCTGAQGIFWAGSNQISNGQFVDRNAKALEQEMLSHPKKDWLKPLPIYAQTQEFNVNLEGTITVSRNLAKNLPATPRHHFVEGTSACIPSSPSSPWTTPQAITVGLLVALVGITLWTKQNK